MDKEYFTFTATVLGSSWNKVIYYINVWLKLAQWGNKQVIDEGNL